MKKGYFTSPVILRELGDRSHLTPEKNKWHLCGGERCAGREIGEIPQDGDRYSQRQGRVWKQLMVRTQRTQKPVESEGNK